MATSDSLDAVFAVNDEHLTVTSGDHDIGEWDLTEITAERVPGGGFHLRVGGEELLVSTTYPDAFAAAVGITEGKRRWFRRRRGEARSRKPERPAKPPAGIEAVEADDPAAPDPPPPASVRARPKRRQALTQTVRRVPVAGRAAVIGALTLIVLVVLVPAFVALLFALSGLLILIIAALAAADDILVFSRLPMWITEWVLLGAGLALLVLGLVLIAAT